MSQEVFLSNVDEGGRTTLSYHICWDREKFIQAQREQARKNGGTCAIITREQFKLLGGREL